jgi:hypothetical protein
MRNRFATWFLLPWKINVCHIFTPPFAKLHHVNQIHFEEALCFFHRRGSVPSPLHHITRDVGASHSSYSTLIILGFWKANPTYCTGTCQVAPRRANPFRSLSNRRGLSPEYALNAHAWTTSITTCVGQLVGDHSWAGPTRVKENRRVCQVSEDVLEEESECPKSDVEY